MANETEQPQQQHTDTEKREQQQPHHQPATISKFFKQLE